MTIEKIGKNTLVGADCGVGRYIAEELRHDAAPAGGVVVCLPPDSAADEPAQAVRGVECAAPQWIVLISSWEVYPEGVDEKIFENSRVSPDTIYGEMCRRCETLLTESARRMNVPLAILRPAMLFGTDVGGEGQRIFAQVVAGRFFTIRDRKALRSTLCALDLARVAVAMAGRDGIFNVADPTPHPLLDIANAMSDNTGMCKRTPVLPLGAAKWVARLASIIPGLPPNWKALPKKCADRVLDTRALAEVLPEMKYHDTVAVIARTDPDYPYQNE